MPRTRLGFEGKDIHITIAAALAFVVAILAAAAVKRRLALWKEKRTASKADFYILVMDIWAGDDPHAWLYSAQARTQEELLALPCYEDPPKSMHRASVTSLSRTRVQLPCCHRTTFLPMNEAGTKQPADDYGPREWGTVHGMKRV